MPNELDETEINAQLLIDEYYATNDNEEINDNDVKLIYGLSFLFMLIWPYSKRYVERRKRVNNLLYYANL